MLSDTVANADPAILGALPSPAPEPAEVVEPATVPVNERSLLGLAELLLKAPARIDAWMRDPSRVAELVPRLLTLALMSFALFAAVLASLLLLTDPACVPPILDPWERSVRPALALGLAYPAGMVAAAGVCLPTFYFFGLLAGVRISVLQVTAHVLKGEAATAVLLLGLTPIYLAITLGMLIFHADPLAVSAALAVGLALPFVAGLWGVHSIYVSFLGLADTLPPERRSRRKDFLRRLTVGWAAIYSIVTPVMIWSLYRNLALMG